MTHGKHVYLVQTLVQRYIPNRTTHQVIAYKNLQNCNNTHGSFISLLTPYCPLFTSSQDVSAYQLNMVKFPQTPTVSGMNNMTIPGQQQFVYMQQSPTSGFPTNMINESTPHTQSTLGSQRNVSNDDLVS